MDETIEIVVSITVMPLYFIPNDIIKINYFDENNRILSSDEAEDKIRNMTDGEMNEIIGYTIDNYIHDYDPIRINEKTIKYIK